MNKQKTKSNKILGTVKTLSKREKIVEAIKQEYPFATVTFRPRGAGAYTSVSDAEYFTVTAKMGAVFLKGSKIKGLTKSGVKVTR